MKSKPNKKYYYHLNGKFIKTSGKPIIIPGYEEFDFFFTKTDDKYHIYEGKTGRCIGHWSSRADCIAEFHTNMELEKWNVARLRREINKIAKGDGLSPRWNGMNGRRADSD